MHLVMDKAGRVVVPRGLREAIGLADGGAVDISLYGPGLQIVPAGRTARLVETEFGLVARSDAVVTDEIMFALIDAGRR